VVKEAGEGLVIADMSGSLKRFVLLRGGKGGKGNQHYATSSMQAPKYAQPGEAAKELELLLELKVIADVGLVGFPNVGKSTLLSRVSNARPEIANYHFTTLTPHLGVVDLDDGKGFVMADIPGLIEGASKGVGLGYEFLRHIERTRVLIHIVDGAGTEGRDPVEDIYTILKELEAYNPQLAKRPQVIAANKMDAVYEEENQYLDKIKEEFEPKGYRVFPISAVSGAGLKELLYAVARILADTKEERITFSQEYFPEESLEDPTSKEPFTVTFDEDQQAYVVEGPKIERMLGYTNLDSEKGFTFFQNFLKTAGILEELEKAGIQEGDTVRMYGWAFDYYK
jgi:GTP-binding protein